MTRRLAIQPQAEIDVADAIAWYEEQRSGLGGELLSELRKRYLLQSAVQFNKFYPPCHQLLLISLISSSGMVDKTLYVRHT